MLLGGLTEHGSVSPFCTPSYVGLSMLQPPPTSALSHQTHTVALTTATGCDTILCADISHFLHRPLSHCSAMMEASAHEAGLAAIGAGESFSMMVASAHGAGLAAIGAGESFSRAMSTAPAAPYTMAEVNSMYSYGLEVGGLRAGHSRSDTTIELRNALARAMFGHLATLPPQLGITLHTMQPSDVMVFLNWVWFPHHGKTVLDTGEVMPAASSIRGVMPALEHLFSIHGRSGEWGIHRPWNNPCRSQMIEDLGRGTLRHVRIHGPRPIAAHPLEHWKVRALVGSLDSAGEAMAITFASAAYFRMMFMIKKRDSLLFTYLFQSLQRAGEGAAICMSDLSFPDDLQPLVPKDPRLLTRSSIRIHPPTLKQTDGPPPPSTYMDVPRNSDEGMCFLRRLYHFTVLCEQLGQPLQVNGPIFRPMDPHNRLVFRDCPMTTPACISRLKDALTQAGLYEGETSHSFRRGGMQDDRKRNVPESDTMARGHVKTPAVYRRYTDTGCKTKKKPNPTAKAAAKRSAPPLPALPVLVAAGEVGVLAVRECPPVVPAARVKKAFKHAP